MVNTLPYQSRAILKDRGVQLDLRCYEILANMGFVFGLGRKDFTIFQLSRKCQVVTSFSAQ